MNLKEAKQITGGLSRPSKMPGYGYGLPARECNVGTKLRDVKGSVCSGCYAMKGRYAFANVQDAQYRRLKSITHPRWVEAMVVLIKHYSSAHFRWHDSGDLQGAQHLANIAEIAHQLPETQFWLPTREQSLLRAASAIRLPRNLIVRVSGTMVDGRPPAGFLHTSTVRQQGEGEGRICPAPTQGGVCGDCRACWDPAVPNVVYKKH